MAILSEVTHDLMWIHECLEISVELEYGITVDVYPGEHFLKEWKNN